jgi:hypothetical protein
VNTLHLRKFLPRLSALAFVLPAAASVAAAAEIEVTGPTIELPKFIVTEGRELPPPESWRYAQIPGYEILSNASEGNTRRFIKDFLQLQQVIEIISPFLHRIGPPVPTALLLYGRGGEFDRYLSSDLRDVGYDSLEIDPGPDSDFGTRRMNERAITCRFFGNAEMSAAVVDLQGTGSDLYDPYRQFYREYVRHLLSRLRPRAPAWLEEGLARMFAAVDFTNKWITFAQVGDGFGGTRDGDFNVTLMRRGLPHLGKFFTANENALKSDPVLPYLAHAFVHMCLYGEGQKYQKAFLTFVSRASREPVTEAMFQECFKMSYAKMAVVIRGYLGFTNYKAIEFRAKKGPMLTEPPAVTVREATQSEVGRLKAQALVLAGQGAAARVALIAPYIRGERDPQLLAALGIYDKDHGQEERARKFLEAAFAAHTTNPRACLELARLRLVEAQAQPAGGAGKLSPKQTGSLLQPLFTARSLRPLLPEVYLLIAEVWGQSAFKPQRENLAVLTEGVRRFPRHAELVFLSADLCTANDYPEETALILEAALKAGPEPALKARLEAMRAELPVPAAPAAAPSQAVTPAAKAPPKKI